MVSVKAITWAIDRVGMSPSAKLALLVLANSADDSGVTWLGQKELAERCCFSLRTASSQIAHLEGRSDITRFERSRKNGSRTSNFTVLGPHLSRAPMLDASPRKYPPEVVAAATEHATAAHADSAHATPAHAENGRANVQNLQDPYARGCVTRTVSRTVNDPSDPPLPPTGGRQRDRERWKAEVRAWVARELPDVDEKAATGHACAALDEKSSSHDEVIAYVRAWMGSNSGAWQTVDGLRMPMDCEDER